MAHAAAAQAPLAPPLMAVPLQLSFVAAPGTTPADLAGPLTLQLRTA